MALIIGLDFAKDGTIPGIYLEVWVCFDRGTIYLILAATVILNFVAFIVTKHNCFLYLSVAFITSVRAYLGFFRTKIKRKFNIRVTPMNGFQTVLLLMRVTLTKG